MAKNIVSLIFSFMILTKNVDFRALPLGEFVGTA